MTEKYRKEGYRIALFGTAFIWLALFVLGFLLPRVSERPKYLTVRISLTPSEVVPRQPEVAPERPVPQQQKKVTRQSSAVAPPAELSSDRRKPEKKEQPLSARPEKTAERHTPVTPPRLVKSVEQLMAEQTVGKPDTSSTWDESLFADTAETTSSPGSAAAGQAVRRVSDAEALSGKAASTKKEAPVSAAENTASRRTAGSESSTEATSAALSKIRSAVYSRSAGNGVHSNTVVDSARSDNGGGTVIKMADGSSRVLLDPSQPAIIISEQNARLIDSSRTVTITFKVLPAGNVPLTSVEIQPASLLPLPLQSEIKTQISVWRFAPDTSEAIARFEYSIVKE